MTGSNIRDAIVLSGAPRSLTAVLPMDVARSTVVPIALNVTGRAIIHRAVVRPIAPGMGEIRLRLPDVTAPGSYRGEATIAGAARAVVVDVEALQRIRVHPRQTMVRVAGAASVEFTVTLMNGGNVAVDVPKVDTFDLDDADGQDRALGRSLRAPLVAGEQRVDRFFEELRASHGGEARVVVRRGAGPLPPGETRELTCVLDVPKGVREGRTYIGAWQLGSSAHVVVADIAASTRPNKVRAAR